MWGTRILWLGLGLAICLAGCEKPEEPLTPPAAQQQSAKPAEKASSPPEQAQQTGEPATEEMSADEDIPVLTPDDLAGEPLPEEETVAEDGEPSTDTEPAPTEESVAPAPEPVALFPPELLAKASAHICFFSFNTGTEYYQLKRMVQRLNEVSPAQITVTEYQILDEEPYDSFVALLESGKACDGVVLSGHHTDEFYGERSDGDLEVEDLEKLACDPRYASWFGNVKALWLQGCNTALPVFHNEDVDDDDYRVTESPINFMQSRMDPGDMEESVEDMIDLLEENLNRKNMVNHYMRVFSGATVYGWSFKAPGEQAGAQKSIPYHLAQITRLVDKNPVYYENPLQTRIPETAARRYSEVLYAVLKRPNRPGGAFPERLNEATFIQGWRDHGNYRYKYAFDNHDIEAFPALVNSNNEVLRQLKGLTCLMQQLDDRLDDMSTLEVADYILRDRNLTSYNSYLLWAMLRGLAEGSPEHQQLQKRLSQDDHMVKELRFAAGRSGYSQQDAKAFLAMLNPPVPAKPEEPVVAEQNKPEPPADPSTSAEEKPAAQSATGDTAPAAATSTAAQPAPVSANNESPWYLNEEAAPASPSQDDEQTFEFKPGR